MAVTVGERPLPLKTEAPEIGLIQIAIRPGSEEVPGCSVEPPAVTEAAPLNKPGVTPVVDVTAWTQRPGQAV